MFFFEVTVGAVLQCGPSDASLRAWIPADKISISTKLDRSTPLPACGHEPRGCIFEASCLPWMGPVLCLKAEKMRLYLSSAPNRSILYVFLKRCSFVNFLFAWLFRLAFAIGVAIFLFINIFGLSRILIDSASTPFWGYFFFFGVPKVRVAAL